LWFQDCDFVLIEGHKQAHFPKMLMLDAEGHAERACAKGEIQNVQAVVSCGHGATKTLKVLNEQGHEQKVEFPHFNRDDIQQSAEFILRFLMPVPPLSGLVLIGGQSKRMGQDKSKLQLQGKSQLEASVELCASVCDSVWVSGRSDQTEGHAFIADRLLDMGPIGGILSAMETHPDRAWLVMAVDMPWMSTDVLQELVHQRDPFAVATAYREPEGRFPEPLCAIYEPKAKLALYQFLGLGTRCPRKVLINTNTHLVHCSDPQALGNANTPEDIERWSAGTKPKIKP
jgi:molybdopterin-guanine dinucleotide biosynthesis protein A